MTDEPKLLLEEMLSGDIAAQLRAKGHESVPLYPEIEPYEQGMLDVGDGQLVYWEASGNPDGKPVVALHGGAGSGSSPGRGDSSPRNGPDFATAYPKPTAASRPVGWPASRA